MGHWSEVAHRRKSTALTTLFYWGARPRAAGKADSLLDSNLNPESVRPVAHYFGALCSESLMARTTPLPTALLLALLLPFHLSAAPGDAELPAAAIPVSPGDGQAGTQVADTCPSFSWGAVAGAQRYELAIFDAHWNASPIYAEQLS